MRTSAAVVLVALLSATLGGYPVGDGGWVQAVMAFAKSHTAVVGCDFNEDEITFDHLSNALSDGDAIKWVRMNRDGDI